jgi:uncharacterized membrane protein
MDEVFFGLLALAFLAVIFGGGVCGIVALVKVVRLRREHEVLKNRMARPVAPRAIQDDTELLAAVSEAEKVSIAAPAPLHSPEPAEAVVSPPPLPADPVDEPSFEFVPEKGGIEVDEALVMKWILWIGMTLSVIGVGLFMRYAYNNAWIGPQGRLAIGVLAGLIALGFGERLRRQDWGPISQIFTGGGFAVFYTCIFFSFQVYHLSGPTLSMALAVLVTLAAVIMAVAENAVTIAIVAVIGGFLSPWILSTGENHPHVLFIYIALLDFVALGAAYFRRWRALDLLCFFGTVTMYQGWYMSYYDSTQVMTALFYISLFYLIFLVLPIFHSMVRRIPEELDGVALIVMNAFFSFACFYTVLYEDHRTALGFIALGQAVLVFFLFQSWVQQVGKDTRTAQSLLVIALALVLVAIPIQLRLYGIPIAWSVEGALLIYLSMRYRAWLTVNVICQIMGSLALALAAGALCTRLPLHALAFLPVFNVPFGSWMLVSAAAFLSAYLILRHYNAEEEVVQDGSLLALSRGLTPILGAGVFGLGFVLVCALLSMEVAAFWSIDKVENYRNFQANSLVVLWSLIPAGVAAALMGQLPSKYLRQAIQVVGIICYVVGGLVFLGALEQYRHPEGWLFLNSTFLCRLLFALSLWWGAARMARSLSEEDPFWFVADVLEHAGHALIFLLLALEMSEWSRQTDLISYKMGVGVISALWATEAFLLVWLGLVTRQRLRRTVGLIFFGITIVKVVVWDTGQLEEEYRIVSWLATGVLLLAAGYFYQYYSRRLNTPTDAVEVEKETLS